MFQSKFCAFIFFALRVNKYYTIILKNIIIRNVHTLESCLGFRCFIGLINIKEQKIFMEVFTVERNISLNNVNCFN